MKPSFGGSIAAAVVTACLVGACGSKAFTGIPDDGGTSSSTSDGGDAAVQGDGATSSDANTPPPDAPSVSLPCGGLASCTGAPPTCCASPNDTGGFTYHCGTTTGCPTGGTKPPTALRCFSKTDCPNLQVCCITKNGDAIGSSCMLDSACKTANGAMLCVMGGAGIQCVQQSCATTSDSDWQIPTSLGTCGGN